MIQMAVQLDSAQLADDQNVIDLRDRRQQVFGGSPSVTVVVPTKNEAANLPHVLPHIPDWVDEVLIIDAGSTDGTTKVALELLPDARIIIDLTKGKGAALCTGFENATSDLIVAIDADGSTDPREIPAFVGALLAGADLAKGSRFLQGGGTDDMETHRKLGNKMLMHTVNRLFKGRYSDLCYGYFALRRTALPSLIRPDDTATGFEIETFINIRALKNNLAITEVASFEYDRIHGTSNLNAIRDGLRILRVIITEYLDRRPTHHRVGLELGEHVTNHERNDRVECEDRLARAESGVGELA
jgi:glycosyltransferase involved in cell wall biosynthesis